MVLTVGHLNRPVYHVAVYLVARQKHGHFDTLLLLLLVFSPWAGLGRDQSSVR